MSVAITTLDFMCWYAQMMDDELSGLNALVTNDTSVIWLGLKMNRKIKEKMKPYGHDDRFQQTTQPQVHSPVLKTKQVLLTTIC